ncbi:NECAP1 [Cordylochernes scorpioides]|uniref:NECAP1 n=1 Tax=Cordylochernes scorpioides TaxID=51811 RepID=A0ABY6K0N6_9ARAC|nr:NECAP1 [Cordylochernes scorpioides]
MEYKRCSSCIPGLGVLTGYYQPSQLNPGELFATCPVDKYPGLAIEPVMDSSRYFVIRLQDGGTLNIIQGFVWCVSDRTAFIGIGFVDRGDSFDLNVALQDHFKWLQKSEELEQEAAEQDSKPQLDLRLKEGQTITINMNIAKKAASGGGGRQRGVKSSGTGLLPPPPGSNKLQGPPAAAPKVTPPASTDNNSLLLDLGGLSLEPSNSGGAAESWGEFASSGYGSVVVSYPLANASYSSRFVVIPSSPTHRWIEGCDCLYCKYTTCLHM